MERFVVRDSSEDCLVDESSFNHNQDNNGPSFRSLFETIQTFFFRLINELPAFSLLRSGTRAVFVVQSARRVLAA
jgi:hypothetical protein